MESRIVRGIPFYKSEWGSKVFARTHTPSIYQYYRMYRPEGLAFQSLWLVAILEDEDGIRYSYIRQYRAADTSMAHCYMTSETIDENPRVIYPNGQVPGTMYIGRINHELNEDRECIDISPQIPEKEALSIRIRAQHAHVVDAYGEIDLEFSSLGPSLLYDCPGDIEQNMYRSEPCRVEGNIGEKQVIGFGVIDVAWGPVGCDFTQSKIYRMLEEYWLIWFNEYENGTVECGIYLDGMDEFKAAYYNFEGITEIPKTADMDVKQRDDGLIYEGKLILDGREFSIKTTGMVDQIPSYVSWMSVKVIPARGYGTPKRSFAWLEHFPLKEPRK